MLLLLLRQRSLLGKRCIRYIQKVATDPIALLCNPGNPLMFVGLGGGGEGAEQRTRAKNLIFDDVTKTRNKKKLAKTFFRFPVVNHLLWHQK